MTRPVRWTVTLLIGTLVFGSAWLLIAGGRYGLTLFIAAPVLIGALAAPVLGAGTYGQAAARGAASVAILTCSLILPGLEGVFCIAMTLPLATPLGALGGLIAFRLLGSRERPGSLTAMALLPLATPTLDSRPGPNYLKFERQSKLQRSPGGSGQT